MSVMNFTAVYCKVTVLKLSSNNSSREAAIYRDFGRYIAGLLCILNTSFVHLLPNSLCVCVDHMSVYTRSVRQMVEARSIERHS